MRVKIPFASSGGRLLAAAVLLAAGGACGGNSPPEPTRGALVTFSVEGQAFRVLLTSPAEIAAAWRAASGGPARIPNGRIASGTQVNTGWSWHLQEVSFAETTIELCDGRPSDVEREGPTFGGGRYCPWNAMVVRIQEGWWR